MRSWFRLLCLSLLLSPALPAARGLDLSGAWTGSFTLPATGLALKGLVINLQQAGREVKGTMLMPSPRAEVPLSGTLRGKTLILASPPTRGLTVAIAGRVQRAGRITGTATLDYDLPQQGRKRDRTVLEMTR